MFGFAGSIQLMGGLSMRFARPTDEDFLLELFMSSRPWLDWTSHDRDFVRALYEQQYKTMRIGHESLYPEHLDFVVEKTGQAVARLMIDLGYADWRVTELEIHERARGKGIGSDLMRSLQAVAANAGMPLTLAVPMFLTKAQQFYARLGFGVVMQQPPVLQLAWYPPGHPLAANARPFAAAG